MRIYVPSLHKDNRKISPLLNRPETFFVIRPSQADWYKQNFPLAQIKSVIEDDAPKGNQGLVIARQWIIDDWRKDTSNEVYAWTIDDDWKGFTQNHGKGIKRTHPTIDEAYEFLIYKADENTRIIGPTNSNSEMAFNHEVIRTNKGEAPESCYLVSKKCIGNHRTLTFESQYFAALQVMDNANFKTVQALQLDYYNDRTISTIFNESDYINHSKILCDNTIEEFPQWLFKVKIGKQGTFKVKFQEKSKMRSGLNFSRS